MTTIYADNAATTKMSDVTVKAMLPYLQEIYANASSVHLLGQRSAAALFSARQQAAQVLNCAPKEVFFTSGGSEADNQALISAAALGKKQGKCHIVSTAMEHHAILNCMQELEAQGFQVTYLKPDGMGRVSTEDLKAALRRDTILVSVMMVNNEVGSVMPIAQMAKLTHRLCPDAIFHTDAVQGFLKVPFQARTLGADLISVSSHKIHGPKGAGALYISPRLKSFPPLLLGGGQEGGYRSGTEGTPAIFGFAAAAAAGNATFQEDHAREAALLTALSERLSALPGVVLTGAHEAPHILSVSVPGVPTQNSINILQDRGICVSAGSACAKGHRSHVLTAMNVSPDIIDCTFRVSLSRLNTQEELDALVEAIQQDILPRVKTDRSKFHE